MKKKLTSAFAALIMLASSANLTAFTDHTKCVFSNKKECEIAEGDMGGYEVDCLLDWDESVCACKRDNRGCWVKKN